MKLYDLQQAIAKFLTEDEVLVKHNCKVLAENKGDVLNEIQSIVDRLGCAALVLTPSFVAKGTNTKPPDGTATIVVQVFESPPLNRGKANRITALEAAERIAFILQCEWIKDANGNGIACPSLETIRLDSAQDILSCSVSFKVLTRLDGKI